jgi:glycosyltransferase involved in cell wall biosynthesis
VTSSQVKRPLVSVVIPMFQSEAWIGATLATVEAQTYSLVETIVVDDGSTDQGPAVVAEFASSCERPVRLIRTTNRGVAAARNTGITESDGDFVALLDADDLWGPRKLELQVAKLGDSGAPMCTCGYEFFDDRTGRRTGVVRVEDGSSALRGWLSLEGNGLALASAALISRPVLDELKLFDPEFSVSADLEFALRIAELGHLDSIPETLVRYRLHPRQMHRQVSGLAGDVDLLYDRVFAKKQDPSFERRCRANFAAHLGFSHLLRGRVDLALPYLWQSLCRDPRRIFTLPIRAIVRRLDRRLQLCASGRSTRRTP